MFIAGVLLRKIFSLKELTEGTFFVDLQRQRLQLRASRNPDETRVERSIEGSTRSEVWMVNGASVNTRGLIFRYAANRAQQAMAQFRGAHAVVEDCIFEWSNSSGASFTAQDITVRRCVFQDHGQEGFTAVRAHHLRFDGCTVQRNNIKEYPRGWEAGGNKLVLCREAVLENSRFIKNRGNGVWFDIGNENCTAQVQGWFDIATERPWPLAMQTAKVEGGKANEDLAAGDQPRKEGVPEGLGLEDLKIAFVGNIYALDQNQPLFIWGADWKRKQEFKSLPSLTKTLGFEDQRSRLLPGFPVDVVKRDFRLPGEFLTLVKHAYPQGQVPDCVLGIATGPGEKRVKP